MAGRQGLWIMGLREAQCGGTQSGPGLQRAPVCPARKVFQYQRNQADQDGRGGRAMSDPTFEWVRVLIRFDLLSPSMFCYVSRTGQPPSGGWVF